MGFEAAGDVNGDGFLDCMTMRYDWSGRLMPLAVEFRSGRDLSLLHEVQGSWDSQFGFYYVGNIDVNGDGRPDAIVGAPRDGPNGRTFVYDHQGRERYRLDRFEPALGSLRGDLIAMAARIS